MRNFFIFALMVVLWSSCSVDHPIPLDPSGKITTELVPVASDSLYCRDAVFWQSYCDRWNLAHGGCEAIATCAEGDTAGVGAIVSDTAWVAINPSSHGWIRVPQKYPVTRLQRWTHPHYANWPVEAHYDAPAPPDSIGIVTYPFRTARGKRTLYGFPSEPIRGIFIAAEAEQPEPPAPPPLPDPPGPPQPPEPPENPKPLSFPEDALRLFADVSFLMIKDTPFPASEFPEAIGGVGEITYSMSNVPPGLSFNSTTRILVGTPTVAGVYDNTYRATDELKNTAEFSFTVKVAETLTPGPTDWSGLTNLVQGVEMTPVTIINPLDGVPPYDHDIYLLPPGISFNPTTLVISGTPTEAGKYTVVYEVEDAAGAKGRHYITAVVEPNPDYGPDVLSFTEIISNLGYIQGIPIQPKEFPEAIGGVGKITYSMSGLPSGLSFNPTTRILSGTPETVGDHEILYSAADESGATVGTTFFIVILEPLILGDTDWTGLFNLVQGVPMTPVTIIPPTSGLPPYTHSIVGLPPGISFNPATLVVSGTPTEAGSYDITYVVRGAGGGIAAKEFKNIVVDPAP